MRWKGQFNYKSVLQNKLMGLIWSKTRHMTKEALQTSVQILFSIAQVVDVQVCFWASVGIIAFILWAVNFSPKWVGKHIHELFNRFFNSVFVNSSYSLQDLSCLPIPSNQLNLISFTESDVWTVLTSLDPDKANGLDNIKPKLLKECAPSLAILIIIFVYSFYCTENPAACLQSANSSIWFSTKVKGPLHNQFLLKPYPPSCFSLDLLDHKGGFSLLLLLLSGFCMFIQNPGYRGTPWSHIQS